jgi:hypothetical protein
MRLTQIRYLPTQNEYLVVGEHHATNDRILSHLGRFAGATGPEGKEVRSLGIVVGPLMRLGRVPRVDLTIILREDSRTVVALLTDPNLEDRLKFAVLTNFSRQSSPQ